MIKVKFKKVHPQAKTPKRGHDSDACFDLYAVSKVYDNNYNFIEYDTGIAVDIPEGYVGLVFARSSVSLTSLSLTNGVGVIDSGYHGTVKARFYPETIGGGKAKEYEVGDRICQFMIQPLLQYKLEEAEDFSMESIRGSGGFGSTGMS